MSNIAEACFQLSIDIPQEEYETMVAVLSEIGFYAFEETPAELRAFILETDYDEEAFQQTVSAYFPHLLIAKTVERIAPKDWNAEWEANFHSVTVGDFCEVHPPHRAPDPAVRHHIMVAPKMAFGTGHHATTWLVLDACSRIDFHGRDVLDMGCGTGVLGLLAHQLGARTVTFIDIDPWSEENTRENAALNGIADLAAAGLQILLGDVSVIPSQRYHIVLANINRNVLIADRDHYLEALAAGGRIVLSGFLDFDEERVAGHYAAAGLIQVDRQVRESWMMLAFEKPITSTLNS